MADLNFEERKYLEEIFEMKNGYVLDFSNRTMRDFIFNVSKVDIYTDKYSIKGNSKANRLRSFWEVESNFHVGILLEQILVYWENNILEEDGELNHNRAKLYQECLKVVERLKSNKLAKKLDSIKQNSNEELSEKFSASIHSREIYIQPTEEVSKYPDFLTEKKQLNTKKSSSNIDKEPFYELIKENELRECLDKIYSYCSLSGNQEWLNECITLQSRFSKLQKEQREGIISKEDERREENRLIKATLEFIWGL